VSGFGKWLLIKLWKFLMGCFPENLKNQIKYASPKKLKINHRNLCLLRHFLKSQIAIENGNKRNINHRLKPFSCNKT
jgi:hypothetical protein